MYKIESLRRLHSIRETDTDRVVYSTYYYREAKRICKALNSGAGFVGKTPDFFCIWGALQTNKKDGQAN